MAATSNRRREKLTPPDYGKPQPMPWESIAGPKLRIPIKQLSEPMKNRLKGEEVLGTFSVETLASKFLPEPAAPGQMVLTPSRIIFSRHGQVHEAPDVYEISLQADGVATEVPAVEGDWVTIEANGHWTRFLDLGHDDAAFVRAHIPRAGL
jgi:hypothetical protein